MSGYLWKATVRNVNRALKEINAFEWEGDYRLEAVNRLKELLGERMDGELEQYLGRAWHQGRRAGNLEDYRNGFYLGHLLTEIGDLIFWISRSRKGFISKVLEAYKRRSRSVDQLILACFVLGMSMRKVSVALLSTFGGAGIGLDGECCGEEVRRKEVIDYLLGTSRISECLGGVWKGGGVNCSRRMGARGFGVPWRWFILGLRGSTVGPIRRAMCWIR